MPARVRKSIDNLIVQRVIAGDQADEISDQTGLSISTIYKKMKIIRGEYKSIAEYHKALVQKRGYSSMYDYAREKDNTKKNSFRKSIAYYRIRDEQKQKQQKYIAFANHVNDQMERLKLSTKELCDITGIPQSTIWTYQNRRRLPGKEHEQKLLAALQSPCRSIEEFLRNYT